MLGEILVLAQHVQLWASCRQMLPSCTTAVIIIDDT